MCGFASFTVEGVVEGPETKVTNEWRVPREDYFAIPGPFIWHLAIPGPSTASVLSHIKTIRFREDVCFLCQP